MMSITRWFSVTATADWQIKQPNGMQKWIEVTRVYLFPQNSALTRSFQHTGINSTSLSSTCSGWMSDYSWIVLAFGLRWLQWVFRLLDSANVTEETAAVKPYSPKSASTIRLLPVRQRTFENCIWRFLSCQHVGGLFSHFLTAATHQSFTSPCSDMAKTRSQLCQRMRQSFYCE